MTQILRQSTAVDVLIGPFVDSTNGYDAETGVSPAVKLSKNGQALAAKSDVTTPVHDADGYYNCEFDATDTNTVGTLVLSVIGSATSLPVRHEFQVIEEAVYDAMYAGSAAGPLQSTTAGRTLDVTAGGTAGIDWGNVENPSTAVDLSGTDIQLCDTITTYTGNTVQTGDSFARLAAPAGASVSADIAAIKAETALIVADTNELQTDDVPGLIAALNDPTAAAIADAVWDETLTSHVTADSAAVALKDVLVDTAEIGTAGAGLTNINLPDQTMNITGNLSGSVGSVTGAVGSVTGAVGSVTGNVGGTINGLTAAALNDFFTVDSGTTYASAVAGSVVKETADNAGGSALTEAGIADAVWNEDIVAAHGTADTAGLILSELTKRSVTLSTAAVAGSVIDQILDDGTAVYDRTTDSLQAIADGGGGLTASAVADAVWDEAQADHIAAGTFGEIATETAAILVDTAEIGVAGAGLTVLATQASVDTIDGIVDTILVDTADLQANQGNWLTLTGAATAAALATVDTNVDAILVDTGTTIPATLTDMSGATFSSATDSLEAIRDRGDTAWTTGAGGSPPHLLQNTTIATLASQTSFTLTAGSADDDAYNGAIVVVTDQSTSTQKAVGTVSDYTGLTKTVTLSADPGVFTMAVGDTIDVMSALGSAGSAPTAAQVADAVWDEAQADHTGAGTFGEIATETAAILVDTADLQANQGNWLTLTGAATAAALATVDTNVDAILVDTGTTIPASIAALNDFNPASDTVILADSASHGGSSAVLTLDHIVVSSTTDHGISVATSGASKDALYLNASGTGLVAGINSYGEWSGIVGSNASGSAGNGLRVTSNGTGAGLDLFSLNGDAIEVANTGGADFGTNFKAALLDSVMQTQLTEGYAANGVAPTMEQATFAMHQMLMQFGISGTSLTVRQLDDITTAFVVTLDSASAPTDASRV